MIKNFTQFNESKNILIEEKIEDFFIDFIDDYNLDFLIQSGCMINGSWISGKMVKDAIELCKSENIDYTIERGFQITFGKKDTIRQFELEDMSDIDIEKLNTDLNKCINRMINSMDNKYEAIHIPKVGIDSWSIIFYIVEK